MTLITRFKGLIKEAHHIVISTHLHPDADGIGSQIALCIALKSLGHDCICVNEEGILERYHYLDPTGVVLSFHDYHKNAHAHPKEIDLFMVVDANTHTRIGENMTKLVEKSKEILFMDHHPCAHEVAALHCIDTTAAATGEMVGKIIRSLGVEFTPEITLPLYTAILIDTNSFRYPSVTSETHKLVSDLMKAGGVKSPEAYNLIYGTKKIGHIQMLGMILSSAQTTEDESIAWLSVSEEKLSKYQVDAEDTLAFVNHLLVLDKVKIACMFREQGHTVKVSLRSSGDIDVGIMAQALGGGGHNHSAATIIQGPLEVVLKNTIQKLKVMLKDYLREHSS